MSRRGAALRIAWDRFWFAPASAENLGWCRLLFFAGIFFILNRTDFGALGAVDPVFWSPIWLFRIVGHDQPSSELLRALQVIWRVALAASCVGLFTRVATAVALGIGFYLLAFLACFGGSGHAKPLVVFAMCALALSRCGDAVSIDRWLRARRGAPPARDSGDYRWPIRFVWLAMSIAFFAAGISKLRHSGLGWAASDTLAILLTRSNYPLVSQVNPPLTHWGLWLASHRLACRAIAAGSLAIELAFPLALVSRTARAVLVPAALAMQLGITIVMGPDFYPFIWSYLFWVPWDRVARWVRGRAGFGRASGPAAAAVR